MTNYLTSKLPTFGLKNIKAYYWLAIFLNGWFILPNWFFYYRQHLSVWQVGIVEGVAILTSIILEVPSGALADMIGKKKTIIGGSLAIIIACLLLVNATEFIDFIVGEVIMFVGFAMQSGAVEAFGYDSLIEAKQTDKYDLIIGKSNSLAIIATIVSTFLGGWLYQFNSTAPFYAWIVCMVLSILALWNASEPNVSSHKASWTIYFNHLKEGVKGLFSHDLRPYLFPVFTIVIMIKLCQGIVRQSLAGYFHYNGETFGYLFALVMIPAIFVSFKFAKLKARFGSQKLISFSLIGFLLAFSLVGVGQETFIGAIVFLIFAVVQTQPLVTSLINQTIDSKHRATILSTLALISQIPYIILVFSFSSMVELNHIVNLFQIYTGIILIALLYSIFLLKKKTGNQSSTPGVEDY